MASSIYDKKQKFENIKNNLEAIDYHADNFKKGLIYPLSKTCFGVQQTRILQDNKWRTKDANNPSV